MSANKPDRSFEEIAAGKSQGFLGEMSIFLRENKKWWITPIVVMLVLVAGLIILGGTAAAPFIYTLF